MRLRGLVLAASLAVGAPLAGGGHPSLAPVACAAAGAHHAALVVQHGDGQVLRYCVGFDGPSVTGEQLLQTANAEDRLEYATASYGGSLGDGVCQIDYEPQSYPPSCFSSGSPYWMVFVARVGSGWSGSSLGISNQRFADGDAEGLRYVSPSDPEPPASANGVCSGSAPAPGVAPPPPPRQPAGPAPHPPGALPSSGAASGSASGSPSGSASSASPAASPLPSSSPLPAGGPVAVRPSHFSGPVIPSLAPHGTLVASSGGMGGSLAAATVAILMLLLGVQIVRRRR